MDSHRRSVVKTITYRFVGTSVTALILFIFTGNLAISIGGGLLDALLKMAVYFVHERVWEHIRFGRQAKHESPYFP
jgi:adenylylsulfate kinase